MVLTGALATCDYPLSAQAARVAPSSPFNAAGSKDASGAWKKSDPDGGLRQAFEHAIYSLEPSGHGTWTGVNPAQRLTLEFNEREARLSRPDGSVSFHLAGYGYGGPLRKPARARLAGGGNRVEYRRGDLTEWYINGPQGLEQGFTLAHRPGTTDRNEPLAIALDVTGGLVLSQGADGDAVLFQSSKGVVMRYAGLKAWDAGGRILPSRLELRGSEIRLIVVDQDARYPLTVDPTWTQQQELTPSDGAVNDYFGSSVSVDGDTAVIGAPDHLVNSNSQGAAYVFVRSNGVWSQQQELTASTGIFFGCSVSVSGDTAVIGSYEDDGGNGAAYVFVHTGGVWSQQQELTASDGKGNDSFGASVSVDGDTAVIGANGKNNSQGSAYVFVRTSGVWTQQQELTPADGAAKDNFGWSVSVSGNTALIGAYGKNLYQGAAYVFMRSSGEWGQQQELTASDGPFTYTASFGNSVSLSGATAVIGAPWDINGQGAAFVLTYSGGSWSQQQELTASGGQNWGSSVSVSGDTAVIGFPEKNLDQGVADVFVRSGGVWTQLQELTASDGAYNDLFGTSVSVSGNTALIGAPTYLLSPGAAYVFAGPVLGANSLLLASAAGTSSVVLSCNGGWTATANDSFLHISTGSASGTGNAVVVFTYDAFTGTGTRTGTLTIAGLTLTVTQAGTNYIGPRQPAIALLSSGLNYPQAVAVDRSGNVYIADTENAAIKEWNPATQGVTTLVSSELSHGVAVDASGNVYIAATGSNAIIEWSASTQQVTTLVSSGLNEPYGVAVDGSGNVYIADTDNSAIKEWIRKTGQVTTLVSAQNSLGVALDSSGNVYFTNFSSNTMNEWSVSTHQVATLISSGLTFPAGVAVDGSGNVYIANTVNSAIDEWNASTQQMTTVVGTGLSLPAGVAVDGFGNVYIADSGDNAIKEIPYAFVGPPSLTEPASAGTGALLPVLPSTQSLSGIFAPTSDQTWLSIGTIANGVISFSFTANTSAMRTAHITVLGQPITVTQNGGFTQSITFGALANRQYGSAPFTVSANASSGLVVSFASTTSTVCTVSGTIVTIVMGGTCTIQATQSGNTNYAAAMPVNQSFTVTTLTQTIAFGGLSNQVYGAAPFIVSATASSGLTVSFTSETGSVCTLTGSTITLVMGGTCTIQATQPGNADYAAATPVSQSFFVTAESQTITFGALANQVYGTAPLKISAAATSGLALSFSSTTPLVCAFSGTTVTLVSLGTCSIQATQAGNNTWAAATPVTQSFRVIASRCDVVQDASPSVVDAQGIINEALGMAPAIDDLNGDGVVNAVDIQIVINAALGLGCKAS